MRGVVIAAPRSGSGKTLVALGIAAALRDRGTAVAPAKTGPDYIDTAFLSRAAGRAAINLDPWAMSEERLQSLAMAHAEGADLLLVEGVMGLFDGAADGTGSTADLAVALGLPVILVVDAERQGQSLAPLVAGFANWRPEVTISGLILNRVGSVRHEQMLRDALSPLGIPVLGALPRNEALMVPSRHLGLTLPGELDGIDAIIAAAAEAVSAHIDRDGFMTRATSPLPPPCGEGGALGESARHFSADRHFKRDGWGLGLNALGLPHPRPPASPVPPPHKGEGEGRLRRGADEARLPPLGQRIAIARDAAFAFLYQHWLLDWRAAGAELTFFSPLADEPPAADADAVLLPGGYPELHAARLATAGNFRAGLVAARDRGALIYGECGGLMVLGESLTDAAGATHRMAGLLPVSTRIDAPRRTLGYRRLTHASPLPFPATLTGHEFHYSSGAATARDVAPLFSATDAAGAALPPMGAVLGRVMGSYAHVIDPGESARVYSADRHEEADSGESARVSSADRHPGGG
jgi:cobyrinic acid a,c-diamide synthase